jgi:fluoride exporter
MIAIYIGIGGFLGAISRFVMGEWLHTDHGFPIGTLVVNLIGCFVLGWFLAFVKRRVVRSKVNFLIGTGFLGSFTTFSTFSVESINLIENGQVLFAASYVLATIIAGILFSYIGFNLGNRGATA